MNQQIKTIRIFISSTFKDMHSERDYLVKYVFPELRDRCVKKGLSLVDVDLRWGVTEEEAEQGKAIEICLDEIENCRPFFIGILGERYGWAPETYQVPDYEKYDWLRDFEKGHSITALEIYHGVLRKKEMKPRAFFYFRNPAFIGDVPLSKQAEVKAESDNAAKKLYHLKEDIKDVFALSNIPGHIMPAYPCKFKGLKMNLQLVKDSLSAEPTKQDISLLKTLVGEDILIDKKEYESLNEKQKTIVDKYSYVYLEELEEFGNEVLKNVWEAICDEHPDENIVTDPLLIEQAYHQRFMNSRTRSFIGREDVLGEIANYINDASKHKPLMVKGEPGSGKSALMAMAAQQNENTTDAGCTIVRFVGASPASLDINKLVQNIIRETASHFEITVDEERINNVKVLYEYFREVLFTASTKGRLTIFIDAVNQLLPQFDPHYLVWLPKYLPENVRIVISSIASEYTEKAVKYEFPFVHVGELAADNCKKIIIDTLQEYRKTLTEKQIATILSKADAIKPLYLKVACEELRVFPSFELINSRIARLPDTIAELFEQFLERLEADHDPKLVKDTLCLIESSMYGLLESELLELLKPEGMEKLPVNIWAKLYRNLSHYLMNAGDENEGLLEFFHLQLSLAVQNRYLEYDTITYYKRLAYYGLQKYLQKNGNTINTVLYTGIYLYKALDEDELYKLLQNLFTADTGIFKVYEGIAANLFDWVVNKFNFESEITLKSVTDKLAKYDFPYQLGYLLQSKGNILKDNGKMRWALEFFEMSQLVREQLVIQKPLIANFKEDLAESQSLIGQIYLSMGKVKDALLFLKKSSKLMEELVAIEPSRTNFKSGLAYCLLHVGHLYQVIGDNVAGLSFFEKCLKINEELVILEPERTDFRLNFATTQSFIGQIHELIGERESALLFFEKCQKLMEELVIIEPSRMDFKITLSVNYNNVGRIYHSLGNEEKALAFFEKSLKINEDLVAINPARTDLISDLSVSNFEIGKIYLSNKEIEKALSFIIKSLKMLEELVAIEPNNTDFRKELSIKYINTGKIFQSIGQPQKAIAFLEKSLKRMEELVAIESSNTDFRKGLATCQESLGEIYESLGEREKAISFFEKQKHIIEESLVLEPEKADLKIDLSMCFNFIGKSYLMNGENEKALSFFQKALKIRQELVFLFPEKTDFKSELALHLKLIGEIYKLKGEVREALTFFEKQSHILEKLVVVEPSNTDHKRDLSSCLCELGTIYQSIDEEDQALMFYEKQNHTLEELIKIEPTITEFKRDLSVSFNNIGQIYKLKGDLKKGMSCFEKQKIITEELILLEPLNNNYKRELAISQSFIGMIYETMGEEKKALTFFEADLKIIEELVEHDPTRLDFRKDFVGSLSNIGRINESMGVLDIAVVFFKRSLKEMEELVILNPSNNYFKKELSTCFENVGQIYELIEQSGKALIFYEKQQLLLEELANNDPSNTNLKSALSVSYNRMGMIYESLGDIMKALEYLNNSQKVIEELAAIEPSRTDFRKELSTCLSNSAIIYNSVGEVENALSFFVRSIEILEDLKAIEYSNTDIMYKLAKNYTYAGKIYESKGKVEKALDFFEKSQKVRELLVAIEPLNKEYKRDLSVSYNYIGTIYKIMGAKANALKFFEKSTAVMEELVAIDPTKKDFLKDLPKTFMFVASSYRDKDEIDKALIFYTKALKILEELISLEPTNIDIRIEYGICNWDIYTVIKQEEKNIWLNKTKNVLEPMVKQDIQHAQLNQLWDYVNQALSRYSSGNPTLDSDSEKNVNKRSQATSYYQSGDFQKAKQLLEELLKVNFEPTSTHHHLARICLVTDKLLDVEKHVQDAWKLRQEAKTYIVARLLWYKFALEFLKSISLNQNKSIIGKIKSLYKKEVNNETYVILSQLKAILQKEDAFMEWTMHPVLNHIKPKLTERQYTLLTALVAAMSNKANMDKLNDFEEWRNAKPEELD